MDMDDGHNKSKSMTESDWLQLDELPRPFDAVGQALTALGALSIDDFLSNAPTTAAAYDIAFHLQLPEPEPEKEKEKESEKEQDGEKEDDADAVKDTPQKNPRNYVSLLRQASQNVFGTVDCLNWEFMEEVEPISKQCILTITRPTGATRSYKSDTGFTRRGDAKAQAAQIAVDMGAIDFIVTGDSDALKAKKGLLLNPFDVEIDNQQEADELPATGPVQKWNLGEEPLKKIEDTCKEWRLDKVKPHWVLYNDTKDKKKHGAALRISLNPHVFRSYSVDPVHKGVRAAKIACAHTAIQQGVIDFIKFGNGQTEPPKPVDDGLENMSNGRETPPLPIKGITLQEFYETLPQPFPEDVGGASAQEINAPAWLNVTLQSARGGRLISGFTPVVDSIHKLHGCILRIDRPEETRTYLVDPLFPRRSDARSAVCLLAMSQGVGDYIRGLKEATENKLPADKRKLANEKVLQVLAAECAKVRQGNRLTFTFTSERDAFGCVLKADISSNPDEPDIREYPVKPEYRTKADAKAAVAYLAAETGLVDLLRFRGGPLPDDYTPFWEAQVNGGDNYVPKRKDPERDIDGESRNPKKRKKGNGNGSERGESPAQQPPTKLKKPPIDTLPPKPQTVLPPSFFPPNNARWKKPHVPGSRGLGPTNAYATAGRMVDQDRSGNRSGGISRYPQSYHYPDSSDGIEPHARYDDRMGYRPDPGYPPAAPGYSHPDPYGNSYPASYPPPLPPPPPAQGRYPAPTYHSPPAQPPPPPHHYGGYYGAHSPPPTPTHTYGHYPYPHPNQYPSPYPPLPPSPYPDHYSHISHPAHHPAMYSPPPPPPMSHMHSPPHPVPVHPNTYSHSPVDYRSHHPSHTPPPPPPPSPPRYSHHVSHPSHPVDINSYVAGQQVNNRRRHSTVADFRGRDNWYPPRAPDDTPPPLPPTAPPPLDDESRWQSAERPQTYSSQSNRGSEAPLADLTVKGVTEAIVKAEPPATDGISQSVTPTAQQPSLLALFEFCEEQKIARPAFFSEVVQGNDKEKKYTVWAEKESQRLELPNRFATVEEGYEKLAKRVLAWERQKLSKA
ncbi:hypothetical protein BDN70DRAFT_995885 [Pholiota conissans]|uniref:Uncharacterized protein n=1 Tax=Pholiota conissans TaxID=109636 RepID=A0A9P6CRF2_9AGAR|nr:hypothetical protein BDN70DRAFT_995885 [Pholiota conissans]